MLKIGWVFLILACIDISISAFAHDEADWINKEGWRNKEEVLCCGPNDCKGYTKEEVDEVEGGYLIRELGVRIPYGSALPSPDEKYWICRWGGQTKCFFAPINPT